jgi:DNA-binding transcriptional MerR regulator
MVQDRQIETINAGATFTSCSKLQGFPRNLLSFMDSSLPSIPAKRYFTIGEVGELCGVKPHVLRYWEQEFTQLRPVKRRGNRRYYQHHEVLMIRRIRDLLYDQGFTISGARNKLQELVQADRQLRKASPDGMDIDETSDTTAETAVSMPVQFDFTGRGANDASLRQALLEIRALLAI